MGAVCDVDSKSCVKPTAIGDKCTQPDQCEGFACIGGECREALTVLPFCAAP
jgi:hypothetical protein